MRRMISVVSGAVLVFTLVTGTVLAAPPATPPGLAKKLTAQERVSFPDIGVATWAEKHIAKTVLNGLFRGYDDGTFRPDGAVTRAELVTLAVRLMGREDEALARMNERLNYRDWPAVLATAGWAVGYLVVAHEQGLLRDLVRDSAATIQPNTAASRLDVVVMLVRAMGLAAAADALKTQKLPFKDAAAIPAWAVGFVAVAVREGIVQGYPDGTFQPNRAVKRSEMAVLLDRVGGKLPKPPQGREFEGTILTVVVGSECYITVANTKHPQGKTFRVDPEAVIYLNDLPATLADLRPGDRAELVLDDQDRTLAIFIAAYYEIRKLQGTVEAVTATSITLHAEGQSVTWPLDPAVRVLGPDGTELGLSALEVGQEVECTLARGKVTLVQILAPDEEEEDEEDSDEDEEEPEEEGED